MNGQHKYHLTVKWTGNKGKGTSNYQSYHRSHTISATDKPKILASSDPSFGGDKEKLIERIKANQWGRGSIKEKI
ncbi:MAG: hypothetical protein WD426_19195 [Anditalea sp.]